MILELLITNPFIKIFNSCFPVTDKWARVVTFSRILSRRCSWLWSYFFLRTNGLLFSSFFFLSFFPVLCHSFPCLSLGFQLDVSPSGTCVVAISWRFLSGCILKQTEKFLEWIVPVFLGLCVTFIVIEMSRSMSITVWISLRSLVALLVDLPVLSQLLELWHWWRFSWTPCSVAIRFFVPCLCSVVEAKVLICVTGVVSFGIILDPKACLQLLWLTGCTFLRIAYVAGSPLVCRNRRYCCYCLISSIQYLFWKSLAAVPSRHGSFLLLFYPHNLVKTSLEEPLFSLHLLGTMLISSWTYCEMSTYGCWWGWCLGCSVLR